MNELQMPNMELWQCRPDAVFGDYFCHNVTPFNISAEALLGKRFAILGFACDLGVQRNFGRIGAKSGPTAIRKCLSRLTIPYIKECYDCGDIVVDQSEHLLSGQKRLASSISKIVKAGITPIVLGGGHETAYGHYIGLLDALDEDIAILNFDAHFDLRTVATDDEGTSGTPFRQIHNACQKAGRNFDYYCVGIQPRGNTNALYEFARHTKTTYIEAQEVITNPQSVQNLIKNICSKHKHIYVTICLDVFHYSFAPGVSAPAALGIQPQQVIEALKLLCASNKVASLDVVELNPDLDIDNHTARLAANLIAEFYYN